MLSERKFNMENENKIINFPTKSLSFVQLKAEEVLDKYGNDVLRISFSYLHNKEDAEDILQDTLLQYLKVNPTLESEAHLKAWLLRVAINLSKNKIKSNDVRRASSIDDLEIEDNKEDLSFVWETVRNLPEKYREVIHLFYYEGYSIKEVSMILKKSEGTIKSLLNRGRKILKKELKGVYDFEI